MKFILVLLVYIIMEWVTNSCKNPVSVFRCPATDIYSYFIRAHEVCLDADQYHCLVTESNDVIECCMQPINISAGHKPRYNTIEQTIQQIPCEDEYFTPTVFKSNRYIENGPEHCKYKKSTASFFVGVVTCHKGSTTEDRTFSCDYKHSYAPALPIENDSPCFSIMDNGCYIHDCNSTNRKLNKCYRCDSLAAYTKLEEISEYNCAESTMSISATTVKSEFMATIKTATESESMTTTQWVSVAEWSSQLITSSTKDATSEDSIDCRLPDIPSSKLQYVVQCVLITGMFLFVIICSHLCSYFIRQKNKHDQSANSNVNVDIQPNEYNIASVVGDYQEVDLETLETPSVSVTLNQYEDVNIEIEINPVPNMLDISNQSVETGSVQHLSPDSSSQTSEEYNVSFTDSGYLNPYQPLSAICNRYEHVYTEMDSDETFVKQASALPGKNM